MDADRRPAPPAGIADLTSAWLDDVLGDTSSGGDVEELGQGVGLLGTVVRVRRRGGVRPASVVVKLPPSDPGTLGIVRHFGYDRREAGFYRHLRPAVDIPAPRCHALAEGPNGPVLVLEDLGELRAGDQLLGATDAEVGAVAHLAARIHAAFWADGSLTGLPWLPGPTDEVIAGYEDHFRACWPLAADAVDAGPGERAAASRAMEAFGDICARFDRQPTTLVHGDLRLDNVLFDGAGGAVALDWQLAARGRGAYDLAFFAAGSIERDERRRLEQAMVGWWHDALLARGVSGYDRGAAWRDYRLGLALNLPNPVTALVAVAPGNDRGAALLRANLRRALAAVADHWSDPDPELAAATSA